MTEHEQDAVGAAADLPDDDAPVTYTLAGVSYGVRKTIPLEISGIAWGMAFGVVASNVGMSGVEAVTMSLLVYTGAGQMAAVDLWAAPLPILTIWFTTALVSLRYLVLGASLRPWLGKISPAKAYATLFILVDQSWAMALLEYRSGRRDVGFLLGSCLVFFTSWGIGTALGVTIGNVLPDPKAWSLDFLPTAIFVTLLAGLWRGKSEVVPWLAAGVVGVLVHRLVPGPWYVLLGAVAGLLAGLVAERVTYAA